MPRKKGKVRNNQQVLESAMGPEPTVSYDEGEERSFLAEAFNWYSGIKTSDDAQKYLIAHLKTSGYSKDRLSRIRKVDSWQVQTIGWYARLYDRGLPKTVGEKFFTEHLQKVESIADTMRPKKGMSLVSKPNVQKFTREKSHEILGELEEKVDEFVLNEYKDPFDAYAWLEKNEIKGIYTKRIVNFYTPVLKELNEIGTDPDLKEAYSIMTKRELVALKKLYESIINAAERWGGNIKKKRKPRKRKELSSTDIVKNLKYKKEDKENRLVSINPESIVGSSELWVYNIKYKTLSVYRAADSAGISVKGTTLQNLKEALGRRLRRPEEVLKKVEKTKGKRACKNVFMGLTTKTKDLTSHRINGNMILMKVF